VSKTKRTSGIKSAKKQRVRDKIKDDFDTTTEEDDTTSEEDQDDNVSNLNWRTAVGKSTPAENAKAVVAVEDKMPPRKINFDKTAPSVSKCLLYR
jgi:hypothetical protein